MTAAIKFFRRGEAAPKAIVLAIRSRGEQKQDSRELPPAACTCNSGYKIFSQGREAAPKAAVLAIRSRGEQKHDSRELPPAALHL